MTAPRLEALAAHPIIARFVRALAEHAPREIRADAAVRLAAILLVMRAGDDGDPELLMIKRADAEGDPWSGHIACPGGRMEPADADLAATAVRETREETGVDVARDGQLLGQLDDLRPVSQALPPIIIRPFVAIVRREVSLVLSPEVAVAFWVPLAALLANDAWGTGVARIGGEDVSVAAFLHGDYTVWGLTERVLRQFVALAGATG